MFKQFTKIIMALAGALILLIIAMLLVSYATKSRFTKSLITGQNLDFERIGHDQYEGSEGAGPKLEVWTNKQDADGKIRGELLKNVDFDKSVVFAVRSTGNDGCYDIRITAILLNVTEVTVTAEETHAEAGQICTQAIVYPLDLVKVAKNDLPLVFTTKLSVK